MRISDRVNLRYNFIFCIDNNYLFLLKTEITYTHELKSYDNSASKIARKLVTVTTYSRFM